MFRLAVRNKTTEIVMEIIPVKDSIPILPERHVTAERVLLYAEMFSFIINEKAHNASNTWEDFQFYSAFLFTICICSK
jgi:hypothetical protein